MLKVLELFAGYGSQALALENLGIEFISDISEIDKYAIDAYNQIHGQTKNYGDICGIDEAELPEYDLVTYSSPCQDFSLAGKQRGGEKGSGTRSSLLWECERIIRAVKPKYLLMENVKNLVGKKFLPCFKAWLRTLEELGYNNCWQVLNAKDYGVPQNRERVFVISIRKDLNRTYMFPEPVPLKTRLKDLIEPEVDEKYYMPQEKVEQLAVILNKDISNAVRCGGRGTLDGKHTWDIVPINTCSDGSCQALTSHLHKETVNDCTKFERHSPATGVLEQTDKIRIRKLTPRECWRLMGVKDEQFDRLHGISKTQLYKMAGNSIVVDVLMAIFKNLLISDKETKGQLSLF